MTREKVNFLVGTI